ncbi:MAG: hypothetical protein RMJ67_09530 [Elusimicrobiota bacterium]|nr:hypothetical protein [Endomicrobiia bacterium]MDW7999128.1 hypothetical protein [Thermodesulfovibrio sp.]MDW8166735.1 hypothetical protein [Elusimicrobiota bacterium]
MEREKTFEKTTYLNLPYSLQIDYSKIEEDKYIDVTKEIQPVPLIIDILLFNDVINWLKKEMHFFGLKN